MLTPGIETLRTLAEALHEHEQQINPSTNVPLDPRAVRYLGWGREIAVNHGPTVGVYARGYPPNDSLGYLHSLYFDFISPPSATGLRQNIGQLSLLVFADGQISPSTHSFESLSSAETLVAPLGEWAVETTVRDIRLSAEARARGDMPGMTFVAPAIDNLEQMRQFVDDPNNYAAHFTFSYGGNGVAQGIRVH